MTDRLVSYWENFSSAVHLFNLFRDVAYQEAASNGWHRDDREDDGIPNFGDYTSNLHSEASELWEAWRKRKLNAPCDKAEQMVAAGLTPLTCAEEEIADIIIRALDTAARLKVDVAKAVFNKILFNRTRGYRYGGKLA